tara:strand:- start:1187 stop:1468 length:282 start_codon:yes stop_codon:yes gene_type:complete
MAEVLDKFPENAGSGRYYQGDVKWLDGRVWKLHVKRDLYMYKNIASARTSLRHMSIRRGWSGFRTKMSADDQHMIIQCYKMSDEWHGKFDYED